MFTSRVGSRISSRGRGGGRIFKKFVDFFLRSIKLIFWLKRPCFGQTNFLRRRHKLQKNRPKKAFLGTFLKILTKKSRCSPPSKLEYIGAEDAFNNFRIRHKNWTFQNSTKEGLFGSAGGRIPEGRIPPPKSAPVYTDTPYPQLFSVCFLIPF